MQMLEDLNNAVGYFYASMESLNILIAITRSLDLPTTELDLKTLKFYGNLDIALELWFARWENP